MLPPSALLTPLQEQCPGCCHTVGRWSALLTWSHSLDECPGAHRWRGGSCLWGRQAFPPRESLLSEKVRPSRGRYVLGGVSMLTAPHGACLCPLMIPVALSFISLSSTLPLSQPGISRAGVSALFFPLSSGLRGRAESRWFVVFCAWEDSVCDSPLARI